MTFNQIVEYPPRRINLGTRQLELDGRNRSLGGAVHGVEQPLDGDGLSPSFNGDPGQGELALFPSDGRRADKSEQFVRKSASGAITWESDPNRCVDSDSRWRATTEAEQVLHDGREWHADRRHALALEAASHPSIP